MANRNYTQYILLVAIAVFIIVGIANYGAGPSGYAAEPSDRYAVTEYVCDWGEGAKDIITGERKGSGWHWIGETPDYTWTLGSLLSRTEAYCNQGTWTCTDIHGNSIITRSEVAECSVATEGAVCFCRR